MGKVGRNKPCPCGSGKKYKKCCYLKDILPQNPRVTKIESTPELAELKRKVEQENTERRKKYLEPLGIYINFVKPAIHQGKKFWTMGSRLYYERPPNETFHEFIVFVFTQTLGEVWRQEQDALPNNKRHFIYKSYLKYNDWRTKNATGGNKLGNLWATKPDGWTLAFTTLAFDVYCIMHTTNLPEVLLNRLKNYDQYQGARYEIAVAAIFARLGYKISFLDDLKITTTHPEFIVIDPKSGEEISVEVKSRHREGVIHTQGHTPDDQLLWGDIQRLYRQAKKQNPKDKPFVVFIDLNSPITPGVDWEKKPWMRDIKKMFDKQPLLSPDTPDECTGVIFTNYSYHYQTENEAQPGEHLLTWPLYAKYPIKNTLFVSQLEKALSHYGNIPNLDVEVGI